MNLDVDLVSDIRNSPEFIEMLADDNFCAELWTAFANVDWYKYRFDHLTDEDQIQVLLSSTPEERSWGASFRGMGGVIATLRNEFYNKGEDYMNWYCSNYRVGDELTSGFSMPYGYVSERVCELLDRLGWRPIEDREYLAANGY